VHLYGPQVFKELFPRLYKGWATFDMQRKIFASAKVSLNLCQSGKVQGAVPQRVMHILAAGGLLVTDTSKEMERIFRKDVEYIALPADKTVDDAVTFLQEVVRNHEAYQSYRKAGQATCTQKYHWGTLADAIYEEGVRKNFDYVFYCAVNNLTPETYEVAWQHWQQIGRYRNALTQPTKVRPDFDWETYVQTNQLDASFYNSEMKAWTHYVETGRRQGMILCLKQGEGNNTARGTKHHNITSNTILPLHVSSHTLQESARPADVHRLHLALDAIYNQPSHQPVLGLLLRLQNSLDKTPLVDVQEEIARFLQTLSVGTDVEV
jgi:hypothetical protein